MSGGSTAPASFCDFAGVHVLGPKRRRMIWLGAFVLAGLGSWLLLGRAPIEELDTAIGRAPRAHSSRAHLAIDAPSSRAEISGRVRDDIGKPIAGARVCFASVNPELVRKDAASCVESKSDGAYALRDVAAGTYLVHAAALGFLPGTAMNGKAIFLSAELALRDVDVVLARGGATLSGTVIDATGGPISHAIVRTLRERGETVELISDDDGRFRASLTPGPVTLTARAPDYAPVLAFANAPQSDVTLVLTPASTIRGRVLSAEGRKPMAGVQVRAVAIEPDASPIESQAQSDDDGSFALTDLHPGHYGLIAEGAGHYGESVDAIELGLAESVDGVEVIVGPAPRVSGRVVSGASAEPCPRGEAALTSQAPIVGRAFRTHVGGDGRVTFENVAPGRYQVYVHCDDHLPHTDPTMLEVEGDPLEGLTWRVTPGVGLAVNVVDGANRPVPHARFQIRFSQGRGAMGVMPVRANADGRYESMATFKPGVYTVEPVPQDLGPAVHLELRDGAGKVPVTLRFVGRGSILVTVRSSSGATLDNVSVSALRVFDPAAIESTPVQPIVPLDADGRPQPLAALVPPPSPVMATSLGDGRHSVGPVTQGRYRVRVEDGIHPGVEVEGSDGSVVTVHDEIVEVAVVLARGGTIRGRIVDDAGDPLANVWVSATAASVAPLDVAPGGPARGAVLSDLDGNFALEGMSNDQEFILRAEQQYGAAVTRAGVRSGHEVTLTVPSPGTLRGTAVDASGAPITRFTIHATDVATEHTRSAWMNANDGRWELDRTMPGKLQLVAVDPSGRTARREIALAPRQTVSDVKLVFDDDAPLAIQASPVAVDDR